MRLKFYIFFFVSVCNALFEDQVGKFDWNARHLGCYTDVVFDSGEGGEEMLLAISDKHALGRINTNTGDLDWRQLNEDFKIGHPQLLVKDSRLAVSISDGYVRAFDVNSGSFKWQYILGSNQTDAIRFALSSKVVAIYDGKEVHGMVGKDRMSSMWSTQIDSDTKWEFITVVGDFIYVIGDLKTGQQIRVLRLDARRGGIEKMYRQSVEDASFSIQSCVVSKAHLICSSKTSVFTINFLEPTAGDSLIRVETSVGAPVLELKSLKLASGPSSFFVTKTSDSIFVYTVGSNGRLTQLLKLDRSDVFTLAKNINHRQDSGDESEGGDVDLDCVFAIYYDAQRLLKIFDLKRSIELANFRINPNYSSASAVGSGVVARQAARVKSVHILSASHAGAFQILTVRQDCRVDFHEAHIPATQGTEELSEVSSVDADLEWIRFEALASISNVEMIDLPLSESQARIETEFGAEHEPLWRSFFLRITSQMEQLQRSFVAFSNRFAESMTLLMSRRSGASPSAVLRHLFGYEERRANHQRSATVFLNTERLTDRNFERDYFNLRKLIVVTTLTGSVYAISNDDGEVIWSMYLGPDFMSPITSQLGQPIVPLFIQRGTALFQYASQAAVVYQSKNSKKAAIFAFNPITGMPLETKHVSALKRVEILPFENAEALRPLVLIFENESVEFYPSVPTDYHPPYPVHVMFIEPLSGSIRGTIVDFASQKLQDVWKSELGLLSPDEKIVSAVSKPHTQRVHSQGKVLGDRSVLYKYANPNLIAIASADESHAAMGLWLVDGVSGQIVYSTRHSRVLPPIHLVHCENWLVYTYWNDKARRTEMGIIELYEGLEQTSANHFNSFTPLKNPLVIFSQSYVFPQGVSAMASSETEQGLTSRSLIVAMPFGGVLEVSRRFLDARRPIEMTPELREEMVIPYIPELPVATEDLINYNKTVHNAHGIKTAASGLESTSLVFVYGLDLFYTRVTPSGTFDILKDDFDYVLISIVMCVLIVASVLSKRLWRYQNLKQAWA